MIEKREFVKGMRQIANKDLVESFHQYARQGRKRKAFQIKGNNNDG